MPIENQLFAGLVIIFAAAFLGALAARLLRVPLILGYLGLGMVIGPHVLQIAGDFETVQTLAEFGVVLLLFAIGVEISFRDIIELGKVVVVGGIAQIIATSLLSFPIGIAVGLDVPEAIVLAFVISLSSTMVVLKTLSDRGELHSLHGRLLTGFLLVQDLAFIPMIAILPALQGETESVPAELGFGILKAAAVLLLMAVLGGKVIPWLMTRVAHLGSRELFILTVVAITLGIAVLTQQVGLTAALGAFVAGLLLSESDFGHRALSEVIPLRDTFSALFFVSLGMLTDPSFVVDNYELVLIVVATAVLVKFVLGTGLVRAFGYLPHTALLCGLGMVQVGEFSFILVAAAHAMGIVSQDFLSLIVVSAVLTMGLTPLIIAGGSNAVTYLSQHIHALRPYQLGDVRSETRPPPLIGHTIICGLGRVGSLVAQALSDQDVPFIVIDLDPRVVAHWKDLGYYAIHGSSSSDIVLEVARIRYARLMVISTGDPISVWVTAQHAIRRCPNLDIVARVHWREEGERLQRLGVEEVVWPQMEAGLEMLRHSLHRYRRSPEDVNQIVNRLREHLSFTMSEDVEDVLPPEGLGSQPATTDTLRPELTVEEATDDDES